MKKIVSSPRHYTNSETALKYKDAIGAGRTPHNAPCEPDDRRLAADPLAKVDFRERFSHFGMMRSNEKLKQLNRYSTIEKPNRTGYLEAFDEKPQRLLAQTTPAHLQTAAHKPRDESGLYSSQNFRQKFKEEYRGAEEPALRYDQRHRNSPQLPKQQALRPDHRQQPDLREVNDKIDLLADQMAKIMPIIGCIVEKELLGKKTAAMSVDGQDSEVFESRKRDKECLSVQHEPYSSGFWGKQKDPRPGHLKSVISTEGRRGSAKSTKKNVFATQHGFEEDRESKTESSPISKTSIHDLDIDHLSQQQLLDLKEKVDSKLKQSQYDRSDVASQGDISDFRKRNTHKNVSLISASIKPPVVPTAAALDAFRDKRVLLNSRDSGSNGMAHPRHKQSEPELLGNPS